MKVARRYGRGPRDERLPAIVPHGHWKTTTSIAGRSCFGMMAPWVLDEPMNGKCVGGALYMLNAQVCRRSTSPTGLRTNV